MIRTAFILIALALPLAAQTLAPETSPKPVAGEDRGDTQVDEQDATINVPDAPSPPAIGMRDQLRESDEDYAACLADLDQMDVTYSVAEPLIPEDDVDCGIMRPLNITALASGVRIEPPALLRCATARALSVWARDFVRPASARLPDRGALTTIENGSGYVCRRRNNLPDGKLSEHAFGNAFDVMAFQFKDGSRLAVEPREAEGSMAEAFQDAVRASACLEFSTVLGPGSNASHDDHLHLDIITRSSGYRLCEQGGGEQD